MANITTLTNENGDKVLNVNLEKNDTEVVLATANTYVDKNIIVNIANDDIVVTFGPGDDQIGYINTSIEDLVDYATPLSADKSYEVLSEALLNGKKVIGYLNSGDENNYFVGYGAFELNDNAGGTNIVFNLPSNQYENNGKVNITLNSIQYHRNAGAELILNHFVPGGGSEDLTAAAIINALGYTPYNGATNPNRYKTSVSLADVTNALGYIPYDNNNPSGYITKAVNNLTNYYTKDEINDLLKTGLEFEVVQSLPITDVKTTSVYLVKNGQYYDQWMYIKSSWVMIGTTSIDLSAYAKTADFSDIAFSGNYSDLNGKPNLATVASSGDYNDLKNQPIFPTELSSFTNDVGFVRNNDLNNVNISTFRNDIQYATMNDIDVLKDLDVDAIQKAINATQNIGTVTRVQGGTGLTGDGSTTVVINHNNSVPANNAYPTGTSVNNGGSFTVRDVKYDETGHITSSQDRTITIPEIQEYNDNELRSLIANEANARSSGDSALQSQISGLDTNLNTAIGRLDSLDTTTESLTNRITDIENLTSIIYLSRTAPSNDIGEDGDVYIQY